MKLNVLRLKKRATPATTLRKIILEYPPSVAGGTHSPPATPQRLQNPKWPPGGPKMAEGVWTAVYP